ncbi:hypothetical protein G7K_2170-t1 [Saitoella complicata NRRL Y-17804]|uniref:Dihydrolipoamide acetyltransferase component of pyruvate dehydrogenase complex n=2 Tax=Saitoella complicata (strain BCRC 22490 / CBS 7301 / JCM 7358 / NBRC 10748 / NRRL Y-17804) TaxID=698492 RepID=A0A0E9NDR5_SAICN|nr:hypothetical protein G7K_2170-t1 [Saitoella complicata NRRL Y-17804]
MLNGARVAVSLRRNAALAASRGFQSSRSAAAASNFKMPAMSPTMTEGTVASWKLKEGDGFAAGDVILEIETDKAQMDVEAQEDGILAKIFINNGTAGVKVGTRIAVLAEPGDDLATLEIPADDAAVAAPEPKEELKEAKKEQDKDAKASAKQETKNPVTPETEDAPRTSTPLSPAVMGLLHKYHLEDAVNSIKATGPRGRLLKGDILAHLGKIEKDASKNLKESLAKLEKMDLSNVVKAEKQPTKEAAPKEEGKKVKVADVVVPEVKPPTVVDTAIIFDKLIALQQNLQAQLAVSVPINSFVEKAAAKALKDVPTFALPKRSAADEIFDELVGVKSTRPTTTFTSTPSPTFSPILAGLATASPASALAANSTPFGGAVSIGAVPLPANTIIDFKPVLPTAAKYTTTSSSVPVDIIDILAGNSAPVQIAPKAPTVLGANVIKAQLELNEEKVCKNSAKAYLGRLKAYVENPEQLLL